MNFFKRLFITETTLTERQFNMLSRAHTELCGKYMKVTDLAHQWKEKYEKEQKANLAAQAEIEKLCEILRAACDRNWKNETPIMVATIAANALYWAKQKREDAVSDRTLFESDSYCPCCGHNRGKSSVSTIDLGNGRHECQVCWASWQEIDTDVSAAMILGSEAAAHEILPD